MYCNKCNRKCISHLNQIPKYPSSVLMRKEVGNCIVKCIKSGIDVTDSYNVIEKTRVAY